MKTPSFSELLTRIDSGDVSVPEVRAVLETLGDATPAEFHRASYLKSFLLLMERQLEDALIHGERAAMFFSRSEESDMRYRSRYQTLRIKLSFGRYTECLSDAQALVNELDRQHPKRNITAEQVAFWKTRFAGMVAKCNARLGKNAIAKKQLQEVKAELQREGDRLAEAELLRDLYDLELSRDALLAAQYAREAVMLTEGYTNPRRLHALIDLAQAHHHLSDFKVFETTIRAALRLAGELQYGFALPHCELQLSIALEAKGDFTESLKWLDQAERAAKLPVLTKAGVMAYKIRCLYHSGERAAAYTEAVKMNAFIAGHRSELARFLPLAEFLLCLTAKKVGDKKAFDSAYRSFISRLDRQKTSRALHIDLLLGCYLTRLDARPAAFIRLFRRLFKELERSAQCAHASFLNAEWRYAEKVFEYAAELHPLALHAARIGDYRQRLELFKQSLAVRDANIDTNARTHLVPFTAPAAAKRDIRLFGSFTMTIDQKPVAPAAWVRAAAKLLFKYLAVHHRKPLRFDALADKLHQQGAAVSEKQFYNALSMIRKVLAYREPTAGLLSVNKIYTLDLGRAGTDYTLDTEEFSKRIDAARRAASAAYRAALYEQALSYYRGDLLAEDVDADYLLAPREEFRDMHCEALLFLAERAFANRDDETAMACAKKILASDALHHKAGLILLRSHLRREEISAAVHCYRRFEQTFRDELDAQPPAAMRAIVKAHLSR
ncbi:MAG: hypothetical protein IAF08_04385 [Rhizobacter sp.]|nr:hypothetical protein [Chlorobiales bacterium]